MRYAGYSAAIVTTLAWGSAFVTTAALLPVLSPIAIQGGRFIVGALIYLLLLVIATRGRVALPRKSIGRLLFVALAGSALNNLAVASAIPYLGAGTSSLVIMLVPVLTGLLVVLTGQERFTAHKLLGFAVALAGLVVVVFLGAPGRRIAAGEVLGLLLLFAGALGFAVYNVYSRPLFTHYSPLEVSAYIGLFQTLSLLPFLLSGQLGADLAKLPTVTLGVWGLLAYLGIFCTAIAYFLWYWALRVLGATRVSIFSYLIPVWGISGSALFLGEQVTVWLPAGVVLVVAGIIISNRAQGSAPLAATRGQEQPESPA